MALNENIDIHVKRREIDVGSWGHHGYSILDVGQGYRSGYPDTVIEYQAEMADDRLVKTGRVDSNKPTWLTHNNQNAPNLIRVDNDFYISLEVASSIGDVVRLSSEITYGPSRNSAGFTSRTYIKVNSRVIKFLMNFQPARKSDYQIYRAEEIREFGRILKMMTRYELDDKAPKVEREEKSLEEAARENIERVQPGLRGK